MTTTATTSSTNKEKVHDFPAPQKRWEHYAVLTGKALIVAAAVAAMITLGYFSLGAIHPLLTCLIFSSAGISLLLGRVFHMHQNRPGRNGKDIFEFVAGVTLLIAIVTFSSVTYRFFRA
ncbi:MAG: hypothetical protein KGJ02_07160 [Verrucomicrobiota bacterium]|nr:hypothetical protein [Verrucomicrobiota bacterium]